MSQKPSKKKLKALNPVLFLVVVLVVVALLSYVVPAGSYDRVFSEKAGRDLVDHRLYLPGYRRADRIRPLLTVHIT